MSPVPSLPTGGHGPAPSRSFFGKVLQLARNDAVSAPSRLLSKASLWVDQRRNRSVLYPSPVDQLFKQIELWKIFTILAAMSTGVGSFYHYELLSKECMHVLLLLLFLASLFLTVATFHKDDIPEIAAPSMLAGVSLLIGSFCAVVYAALDLSADPVGALAVFFYGISLGYVALLFFHVYRIVKLDVRCRQGEAIGREDAGSGISTASVGIDIIGNGR